jgi:hypothetical protein
LSAPGSTLIGWLFDDLPEGASRVGRVMRLWIEGILYTSCALFMAEAFGFPESGFFAVFLGAAGLTSRFETILDDNRRDIFHRQMGSLRANFKTAASVFALFLGSFFAFAVAALWIGEQRMNHSFGFVLDMASLGHDTILTRPFVSAPGLFLHNTLVLFAFICLSLVYRAYGALLALVWNACIWGLVIMFLVRRGIPESPLPPALFMFVSALAVLPHLLLEAASYIVGSLAAIFLSKGLLKYSPADPMFRQVMTAVAQLMAVALFGLLLGAVVEASVPRFVLSLLQR